MKNKNHTDGKIDVNSSEPRLLEKDQVGELLWWVGWGAIVAGIYFSVTRFWAGLIAAVALFVILLLVIIAINFIRRYIWRIRTRHNESKSK